MWHSSPSPKYSWASSGHSLASEGAAHFLEDCVGLRQVFVAGSFALDQVRHRVEAQPVDAEVEPEPHDAQHLLQYPRVVEIQVGLMRIKAVPVIGLGHRVPGPVRGFRVDEYDPGVGIGLVVVRPHVIAPRSGARLCRAGALKPPMLVRGVVDDELGDDAYVALMCAGDDAAKIR
jgi:hypothetical protein